MDELWHRVRGVVADMLAQHGTARHGVVKSVDPARGVVRVDFGDTDAPALSGWLPVAQMAAGGGWSGVCLPVPGTQVFAVPDMGHPDHMVVVGAVHSTPQPVGKVTPYKGTSAVPIVPGEVTFMHKDGASLRLTDTGIIEIHGTLKVDGDIIASGDIWDLNKVHLALNTLRQLYNGHQHADPQGGITGETDEKCP